MKYLFVGGPARSGTTQFATLVNRHPYVALGIERYKFLYADKSRHDQIGPQLFETSRFFEFDASETNIPATRLEPLKRKFDNCTYRGDKIPHVMRYRSVLEQALPSCRFIIMYRDVNRICSSWNRRAQDSKDHWPEHNNFRVAVGAINKELGAAVDFQRKSPDRILFVRYESIFGLDAVSKMRKVLDWLELPHATPLLEAVETNISRAEIISSKSLLELQGQREFIRSQMNWSVIQQVETLAI